VSVHPDRGAWVVRWRQEGRQRSRRFATEPEALAFEEGLSGGSGKPRSSTPNVYPYETRAGIRWRYSYDTLQTERWSVATNGSQALAGLASGQPAINDGGDAIAFASDANNLFPGDTLTSLDVFLRRP
jgi:hypothetical protein